MSAALYAGDYLIGTLEYARELNDSFDLRIARYRFTPCAAFEAFRELLDPRSEKKRGKKQWFEAIDALDLRLIEEGREERYRFVFIEGEVAAFRAGDIRLSAEAEKEWRGRQATHRSWFRRILDVPMPWSR
jgi:hypothetical protein